MCLRMYTDSLTALIALVSEQPYYTDLWTTLITLISEQP